MCRSSASALTAPACLPALLLPAGKFYTLLTGSNEKRWSRMQDKVKLVVQSFTVEDRTAY